ncbi:MAG TPA: HEPN domain-containing protein [Chitinophagaceae bacterium]|jgi:HEPN domain-containing protein
MLTCYNTIQLKKVINTIITIVPAEKIFLLAVQTTCPGYATIFTGQQPAGGQPCHYWLLVLPESNLYRSNESWQDMIEHCCRTITPVTAWVIPVHKFVQWLQAGQPFAARVCRDGFACHDAGRICLPAPPPSDEAETEEALCGECMQYINRSVEFFEGAELYYLRRRFKLAAFLLHQSAEQAYIAISWRATGFRPMVHSLEKLRRYALPFSEAAAAVFPQHNERELQLFRLLQKAYIDTRYTSDYEVSGEDLLCLMGRVEKLMEIARRSCEPALQTPRLTVQSPQPATSF